MAFSKETRIKLFIAIDVAFFLLEIIVGYTAHSLALVADAFHMLNDVLSLCVGLWAVRVATKRSSSTEYTYGWARAELLGGLVNGVFLVALCLSIVLDAIQRFFEPQEVQNPKLVLIVGAVGLAFNILGLFVFHQHSHSHGDEHGEEEVHGHKHTDELIGAEQGQSNHQHSGQSSANIHEPSDGQAALSVTFKHSPQPSRSNGDTSPVAVHRRSSVSSRRNARRQDFGADDIPIHPASLRNHTINYARRSSPDDDETEDTDDETAVAEEVEEPSEVTPLFKKRSSRKHSHSRSSHKRSKQGETLQSAGIINHKDHKHNQPKPKGASGHGHSHEDMNIRGMFLHVLGDALGNVGVMASALIIWLTPWPGRYYCDPAISLFITLIILKSAIPLCRDTAKPLLQAVPSHVSVDDIREDIEDLPGVRSCHHVHVWALTPSKLIATLDVELDFDFEGKNATKYMELAKEIKGCLHGHGIHNSTIQPEFCTDSNHEHTSGNKILSSASSTVQTAIAPGQKGSSDEQTLANRRHDGAGCGDGSCLLDCTDKCSTGRQCCGPASQAASGTTTPKRQEHSSDEDHHNSVHR